LSSCDDKEIPAIDINEVPKKFFNIQNGSKLTYVNVNDTNKETDYFVANYYNTYVNPDISNNEVLSKTSETYLDGIPYDELKGWRNKIKKCKFQCWDCNYCDIVADHKKKSHGLN
jgi:hypothetical protein